jgi:CHAD domain-containing protein
MRVATRRMRAAFQVFGAHFEKKTRNRLLRGLQRTGRALGAVRDLDVFMEYAQQYLAELPAEQHAELDILFNEWRGRREKARAKMLAYLDSEAYREFVENCQQFVETPGLGSADARIEGPAPVQVMHVAPRQIYTRYEAVRAYEPLLDHAAITTLHALRIEAKRLRYTLEFFREVLGPEAGDVIGTMVMMQDHLGALHDADVAQALLRGFMEKALRRARKQQRKSLDPVELPSLGGVVAYLDNRERELTRLRESFPEVWAEVTSAETRRTLAAAVGVV